MRSVQWAKGSAVYVADRPGRREPAEVLVDRGVGLVEVELEGSGASEFVDPRHLQLRRVSPSPPPGAGGRDVEPLKFPAGGVKGFEPGSSPRAQQRMMAAEARPGVMAQLAAQPKPEAYRNADHLAWVRTLSCVACPAPAPSEAAHFGPHPMGRKPDDDAALPLCARCHNEEWHRHGTIGRRTADETRAWIVVELDRLRRRRLRELYVELAAAKRQVGALLARSTPAGGG